MAYLDWSKIDVAEEYLKGVALRMPKAAPLYVTLGLVQVKRGQAGPGMAQFKRALELDPNNAAARVNAAFLALAYRDYQQAMTHLDAAVGLGAVSKEVVAGRCYALEGLRQGEGAAACFAELAARPGLGDNERAGYFYALGSVHQMLTRKPKSALEAYRRYVELKGAGLAKTDKVFQVIKKLEASSEETKPRAQSPGSQARPTVSLAGHA
jgi:tetratricopeptide (TPR) repeat protein